MIDYGIRQQSKIIAVNVFISIFLSCHYFTYSQNRNLDWVQETDSAEWQPRDSQGEVIYKGKMWIFGGWFTPRIPNPRDVWKSKDGKKWTQVTKEAPWIHSDLPAAMVFKNKMWMMGGRKLPGSDCSNQVWSSKNGSKWKLVTDNAGWSPRLAPGFVVFKDKMWILGGTSDFYNSNDSILMNDVWSSADGKTWKLETDEAPWSKRAYGQAIVFDDKIWMIGGGQFAPEAIVKNDVWCSEDGINWKQVTSSAPWDPRLWFSTVVYRDRIWLMGGMSPNSVNFGDVWYTDNGMDWTELKSENKWSRRHEHSAFVFKDKIWIAGGAAEPKFKLDSEVWSLHVPKDWFEENNQ